LPGKSWRVEHFESLSDDRYFGAKDSPGEVFWGIVPSGVDWLEVNDVLLRPFSTL